MRWVQNLFRGDGEVGSKFIQRGWQGGFKNYSEGIVRWVRNLFRRDGEGGSKFIQGDGEVCSKFIKRG